MKMSAKTSLSTLLFYILLIYNCPMDFNYISIIGLMAGTCTTMSFFPQVIKTIKSKETKDLSLSMYIVLATGILLWTVYGILINDIPVIIANGISFALAAIVLGLKLKYG